MAMRMFIPLLDGWLRGRKRSAEHVGPGTLSGVMFGLVLPSGYVKKAIENMAIEIVSFPIKNGGSFHSYVSHYQRVNRKYEDIHMGLSENSVPLNPMVNDHYPY